MTNQEYDKMRKRHIPALLILATVLCNGCAEEETKSITLTSGSTTELYSVTNQSESITFKTEDNWKANCTASWLTFSPKSGEQGENTITVSTTSTNRTKKPRTAQLTIESGGKTKSITIRQRDEYAFFDTEEVNLSANATTIALRFWTNLEQSQLNLYATEGLSEWVTAGNQGGRTKADYQGSISPLYVQQNTSRNAREGAFFLVMEDAKKNILGLDTLFIHQEGSDNGYVSNDYSADGKVELLHQATKGKGIPVVLMGDGFVDEDIADSSYAKVMSQAMENIFSEEPIKSLRDYFNVYQVTAVSPRNRFDGITSTAFGTIPDHQTTGIDVDADAVMRYVKKVDGIDSLNTLTIVILNTTQHKGVTYMFASEKKPINYAIALCPVIDSLKSEEFREVLTHEAIGHGFAKLADEYVRATEGSATDKDIEELKQLHQTFGWYLNVDSEKDTEKVLWNRFINDPSFSNERISTYEGGYTFYKGVFRPTEESMMRSNDAPFNGPSRQAIYNKVMQLGLGTTPTYEEFVAFDEAHKPQTWSYKSRTRQKEVEVPLRMAPPRIIWRNW